MKKYKDYLVLTIFTMGSQALLYFLIKIFISDYNILDSIINVPLVRPFIYIYNSWYPFIVLCTFLVYKYDKKVFRYMIATMLLTAFFAHITFILYPSEIIRPAIDVNNFTDWLISFTYMADTPAINCLPSMHCAYCFIMMFYILKSDNKYKYLVAFYSFVIVLSTLFTKQHIIEDAALALVYVVVALVIIYSNKDKIIKLFNKIKFLN